MKKRAPHVFKDIKTVAAKESLRQEIERLIAASHVEIKYVPIIIGRDIKFNPRTSKEARA
jgi:hypothetical protein